MLNNIEMLLEIDLVLPGGLDLFMYNSAIKHYEIPAESSVGGFALVQRWKCARSTKSSVNTSSVISKLLFFFRTSNDVSVNLTSYRRSAVCPREILCSKPHLLSSGFSVVPI